MKDPAFLFYSSDFLSGVQDLTMEERGQYITLLCIQHQKGHLTEKMIRLSCGNAAADVLAKFEKDESGNLFSKRLDIEIEKRREHADKQRQRALEGWKKRKSHGITTADATALPLENENEIEDKDVDKDESVKKPRAKKKEPEIPTLSEFVTYGLSLVQNNQGYKQPLEAKYNAWHEAGWKDGHGVSILNWKTKLQNTIQYLRPMNTQSGKTPLTQNIGDTDYSKTTF